MGVKNLKISKIYLFFKLLIYFLVVAQTFEIRVIDEFVLLGNAAIMKCLLPSFVTDFIQVVSWVIVENEERNEIPINGGNNWGKNC